MSFHIVAVLLSKSIVKFKKSKSHSHLLCSESSEDPKITKIFLSDIASFGCEGSKLTELPLETLFVLLPLRGFNGSLRQLWTFIAKWSNVWWTNHCYFWDLQTILNKMSESGFLNFWKKSCLMPSKPVDSKIVFRTLIPDSK